MKIINLGMILLSNLVTASCVDSSNNKAIDECVVRGIAYFKEIGSYPTLKSDPNVGRNADDVARERCNRAPTAF